MTEHELADVLSDALELVDYLVEQSAIGNIEFDEASQGKLVELQARLITATDEACCKLKDC